MMQVNSNNNVNFGMAMKFSPKTEKFQKMFSEIAEELEYKTAGVDTVVIEKDNCIDISMVPPVEYNPLKVLWTLAKNTYKWSKDKASVPTLRMLGKDNVDAQKLKNHILEVHAHIEDDYPFYTESARKRFKQKDLFNLRDPFR